MLTTDEAIVDIDFQVVWNINNPAEYLFNLRDGPQTVRAVSESAMREIVAGSDLAPLLNRDRAAVAQRAEELIQLVAVALTFVEQSRLVRAQRSREDRVHLFVDTKPLRVSSHRVDTDFLRKPDCHQVP